MSDFLSLLPGSGSGSGMSGSDVTGPRATGSGITGRLTGELREAIGTGRLRPGFRLPATRRLAAELGVSRGVVVEAYQRLVAEGLVAARTGAGTVVIAPAVPSVTSDRRHELDALRLPLPAGDGIDIDLSPGVPDLAAFPRTAWLKAERAVLAEVSAADLGYGDPGGAPRLRAELASWLARTRGVRAQPDDVIVTGGVAQALALLAQVVPERDFAVEDPGSRGARDQLAHWGVRVGGVPVDDQGLRVREIRAPVVVVTPAHQFPTGVVLSPSRRRELLSWDGLIIEDDYDAEHRYDRAPVAALQGSAPGRVAYAGSVSKSLAPGMRLGWLIAPPHLRSALLAAKHATDLGSPAIPQLVLARLIADGDYDRHLRAVRTRQRRRRDALLAALRSVAPQVRIAGVAAGLHLLVLTPGPAADVELSARAASAGVRVQPLSWHRIAPGPPGLVMGYAAQPTSLLQAAAARLGPILRPAPSS